MSGYIKLWRGWRDCPPLNTAERQVAWIWMLEAACWKPKNFNVKGKTLQLRRGQFCASREQMAAAWNWSPSAVERFLTRLKSEQMIGQETGQGKSVITINNYCIYQGMVNETGQEIGQGTGQTSDRHRTAKEESKKVKKEEVPPKAPRKRWVDIPDGVDSQLWSDWRDHRKTVFTETALAGMKREAGNAGWTLSAALAEAMERGWQGFKADWVKGNGNGRAKEKTKGRSIGRTEAALGAVHQRLSQDSRD